MQGDVLADLGGGVSGTGAETGDFHGNEVVNVIPKETGALKGDRKFPGELPQGTCLVAGAFHHMVQVHFGGVAVHQRGGFAGDEGQLEAEAAQERYPHDVGEGEPFHLVVAAGVPAEGSVGENAIDIKGDGLQGLQAICQLWR